MLLLNDIQLESLLTPLQLVDTVERAMRSDELNENLVPQRMHVTRADNTYLLMPAYGNTSFGTKLVSVMPANAHSGQPVIRGLYSLNDSKNGALLSLMSASKLTALRTGAIAAVAVRTLTQPNIDSIGIIGPGVQAVWIAICTAAIRPIKRIYVQGRSKKSLNLFLIQMQEHLPDVEIIETENSVSMLEQTETIITATTSDLPVLPNDTALLRDKTFVAMGSYRKTMRELPDPVFQLCGQILIDAPGTKFEVGDVLHPLHQKLVTDENVVTLGSILTNRNQVRSKTKVFKSAGYALFDLFVAEKLYEAAASRGIGQSFSF